MAARVTQEGVEVLLKADPAVRRGRVTQVAVELLLPNEAVAPAPAPGAGRSQVVVAG